MSEKKLATLAAVLSIAVTIIVYWHGLSGPFVFDDYTNTTQLHLNSLHPGALANLALSNDSGFLHRPVSILTLGLNKYFSGANPFAYKLTNVVIHIACALALLFFAITLLRTHRAGSDVPRHSFLIALFGVTLWLVHPLQVSTVLYVVQRMAELSALFSVLALSSFVLARIALNQQRRTGFMAHALACMIFTILAVLSKENGVLIPLYMALVEWLFFHEQSPPEAMRTWYSAFIGLFIVTPVVLGFGYFITHLQTFVNAGYTLRTFTMEERLLTEAQAIWFYLKLIFVPQLNEMSLYHDDFAVVRHLDIATTLAIAGIVALLTVAVAVRRKAPFVTFGILWFFIGHVLESTVLPLELIFEHRNYLPLFGPMLMVSHYLVPALMRVKRPLASATMVGGTAIGLLVFLTIMRVDTWSSKDKLFLTTSITHPDSSRTRMELANLYILGNEYVKGEQEIREAIKLAPWNTGLPVTLLIAGCQKGSFEDGLYDKVADTIRHAQQPGLLYSAMLFLETKFFNGQCPPLTSGQLRRLTEIIIDNKNLTPGPRQKFTAHFLHARVLARSGQVDAAQSAYLAAYHAKPFDLGPLFELAYIQLNNDLIKEAAHTMDLIERADEKRWLRHQTAQIEELRNFIRQASRQPQSDREHSNS